MLVRLVFCSVIMTFGLFHPFIAFAGSINFDQESGSVQSLQIVQTGLDQALYGFGVGKVGIASPLIGSAALIKGDFNNLHFTQTTTGGSSIALRAKVILPSNILVNLSGSGAHRVTLDAVAGTLNTRIFADGIGSKQILIAADASAAMLTQDITLYGGPLTMEVKQNSTAALTVKLTSTATSNSARSVINQHGENSSSTLTGMLGDGAQFDFTQNAVNTDFALDVNIGANSYLIYTQDITNSTYNPSNIPLSIMLPANNGLTIITQNQ